MLGHDDFVNPYRHAVKTINLRVDVSTRADGGSGAVGLEEMSSGVSSAQQGKLSPGFLKVLPVQVLYEEN